MKRGFLLKVKRPIYEQKKSEPPIAATPQHSADMNRAGNLEPIPQKTNNESAFLSGRLTEVQKLSTSY